MAAGRPDRLDRPPDSVRAPVDPVTVAVSERVPEAGDPDDVGLSTGEAQHSTAVATDEERHVIPNRPRVAQDGIGEREVLAAVRGRLTVEQPGRDIGQLYHPRHALSCGGERSAGCRPLRRRVSGADTEHGPTVREDIQRCHCAGERKWLPHSGVHDTRSELGALSHCCRCTQSDERRRRSPRMVRCVQRVESTVLDSSGELEPRGSILRSCLNRDSDFHLPIAARGMQPPTLPWVESQLDNYADLRAIGLIDVVLDGTLTTAALAK